MGILSQAIQIQNDGVRFYSDQAEKSANTALRDVFSLLAEDEKRHAMILQAAREGLPTELRDGGIGEKVATLFETMESVKQAIPAPTEQADVYFAAWEMEKKAASLYEQLMEQSSDPDIKALYAFLIDQEQIHAQFMEQLYRHVNRPNEWVEAAEFGLREEY
ncbi:MAG: ferritin family protein [Clostridiales bacterium]|mgnify:FL=1|nr:ferritin family protein [Clostridiales bacterium]